MPIRTALQENPHRGEEMLVTFEAPISLQGLQTSPLRLVYIPDRDIILKEDFTHWVEILSQQDWESPEAFTSQLCSTFYNEVMPFFLDVKLEITHSNGVIQRLESIKNQPQYKVPEYLLRKI